MNLHGVMFVLLGLPDFLLSTAGRANSLIFNVCGFVSAVLGWGQSSFPLGRFGLQTTLTMASAED